MSLASQLKKNKIVPQKARKKGPVWEGPNGTGPNGGITYSLLSRFLNCRERFRILVVEGLKPAETFYPPIDFGNMWHICEEALAAERKWGNSLYECVEGYKKRFPFQRETIDHWHSIAVSLFPQYIAYWKEHPDVKSRIPLFQEQPFDVQYKLPSGREVRLRGKWDSVDLIESAGGIFIQENKTKSSIDTTSITRQCSFDLQTMIYLVALHQASSTGLSKKGWTNSTFGKGMHDVNLGKTPIRGIRYNVIRRSAHKSIDSMLKKVEEDSKNGRIGEWFARWMVEVSADDVERFRKQCLDPILENLCDWWAYIAGGTIEAWCGPHIHWRHPFGVYNVLDEGGSSDLDAYLAIGSEAGLRRADDLFPELK